VARVRLIVNFFFSALMNVLLSILLQKTGLPPNYCYGGQVRTRGVQAVWKIREMRGEGKGENRVIKRVAAGSRETGRQDARPTRE
jgi:low temperature requirement protein LtrA